jgi:hypothetical protein
MQYLGGPGRLPWVASMWLPYTPEQKSEFVALAELYSGAREAFRSVAAASRWQRTPGSRAAADWDAIVARRPALSPGGESLMTGLCHHYLYAAGEQLGALSALYAANEVLLSPNVIARCAVEHAAHIVWVLGAPGDGVDERLARTFLEELADAEHAKTTAGHLIGKAHPEYRQRLANWKELKADVTQAFPAPTTDHEGRPRILGQGLPRPEEVVVEMYGRLTPALPEKQRQGIYDLLSNHVPGTDARIVGASAPGYLHRLVAASGAASGIQRARMSASQGCPAQLPFIRSRDAAERRFSANPSGGGPRLVERRVP